MIDFKLALQLKEAGFPQNPMIDISGIDAQFFGSFYYLVKHGLDEVAPNFLNEFEWEAKGQVHAQVPTETVKIPTLEELIAEVLRNVPNEPANYSFELRFEQYEANPDTEPLEIAWKWIATIKPIVI